MADTHLADGNARQAARLCQERFPNRYIPGHRMFSYLHQRLRDNGKFEINRRDAGRQRRVDVEEAVLDYFHRNPRASTRGAAEALGLQNHWEVWSVLNGNHYQIYDPYHFQRVQALNAEDYERRAQLKEWYLNKELQNPNLSELVLFSDEEATFTRSEVFDLHDNHELQVNNRVERNRHFLNIFRKLICNSMEKVI